jgi:phosphoglycolate phosphatase
MGGRPLEDARYWRLKRRGAALAEVLERSGLPAGRREEFLARFVAEVEAPAALALDRLLPGVPETLAGLAGRGDRLVLLSLRHAAAPFLAQVDALGLAGMFAQVQAGRGPADPGLAKARLIERVGFAGAAVVVGDTEADVGAGLALGLPAVAVSTGLRTAGYLRRAGAAAVADRIALVPALIDATQAASSAMPSSSPTSGR